MLTTLIVIIVALVFVGAAIGGAARHEKRKLRASFGPEYEAVARDYDTPRQVDRELRRRRKTHNELDLRPISARDQEYFTVSWENVQGEFSLDPLASLNGAERLIDAALQARGYPGGDPQEQLALLSVEHAGTMAGYRTAQQTSRRAAADPAATSTEEMRQALLSYQALFTELLGDRAVAASR